MSADVAGIAGCLSTDGTTTSGVAMLARCAGVTPTTVFRWMRDSDAKRGALAATMLDELDALPGAVLEALGKRLAKLDPDDVLGPPRLTLVLLAKNA